MTTLDQVKPDQAAIVKGFTGAEPPGRLLEMGLLPGTHVKVVRHAPFGDPIDLKVRGFHLSIRKHEAALVEVEPL